MTLLQRLADALIRGDHVAAADLTREALAASVEPKTVLEQGLLAGMKVVGERFRVRDIFLPDVLLAARAMAASMEPLEPLLATGAAPYAGKVVLATVKGDLHDIGKNLVGIMLRGAGFQVVDLGMDVAPEAMLAAVREHQAPVLGMSALLTTTMPVMGQVVARLKEEGLHGEVRTLVGGAPLSEAFARTIGADAYGPDAYSAVETVKRLAGVG